MSLNKFTDTQKGLDLNLEIGCEEFKAVNATIDNLTLDGGLILPSNIQSQSMASQNVANTTAETSLFSPTYVGTASGTFPANSLSVGDTVSVCLWGRISSSPTAVIDIRFYVGNGSFLLAETDPLAVGALSLNEPFKIEVDLTVRSPSTARINGRMVIWDSTTGASTTYEIKEKNNSFDITQSNTMELTAQWAVDEPTSDITVQQYKVLATSVAPR